jgi:hypothetical protein
MNLNAMGVGQGAPEFAEYFLAAGIDVGTVEGRKSVINQFSECLQGFFVRTRTTTMVRR